MKYTSIRKATAKTKNISPDSLGREMFTYVDISSIDRELKHISDARELYVFEAPSRARKEIKTGDVLVSTVRPNLNAVAYVDQDFDGEIASTGFCVLRSKSDLLDSKYLFYFTQTNTFVDHLTRQSIGAGYPAVSDSDILDMEIPLPPIEEQRQIAGILARADRLRQMRRYALQLSDTYLQSVFLRMFGGPVTNPRDLPIVKFGDVCESRLGKMLDKKQQTGRHTRPYLRNVNVQWGRIELHDLQEMDFDKKDRKKYRLRKGDVLICEGGEVGRAAIWNDELDECYFQKALHRVRPDPKLAVPEFILWLMHSLAKLGGLGDFTSQVTIAHLTGVKLKTIEFPLPPLSEQKEFATITRQFKHLQAQQREALRQADHLFDTLLHRAFQREG